MKTNRLATDTAWALLDYSYGQGLRLALNVALARILAPSVFGIMSLVTTLRTGVELLTDVGVGQSIVVNKKGDERSFIETAWTIQLGRGFLLALIGLGVSGLIGRWYHSALLGSIFATMSVLFLIGGMTYPSRAIMQRRQMVRRIAIYESIVATCSTLLTLALVLFFPNVWGLAFGTLAGAALTTVASFLVMPVGRLRPRINAEHARSIASFGRWIFLSSLIYFVSSNFDRLYLPTVISFTVLGIYGIAKSLADVATQLIGRLATLIILPAIAKRAGDIREDLARIKKLRRGGLLVIGLGLGGFSAFSQIFIRLAYDERYHAAALFAPVLILGSWFSIQANISEAVLLGLARPRHAAGAGMAKLLWMVVLLPLSLHHTGLGLAICVMALADVPRYAWLAFHQRRAGLAVVRQDLLALGWMILVALACQALLFGVGLLPDPLPFGVATVAMKPLGS